MKTPSDDQVGLKKLPKAVRNKMGYMKAGGNVKKKGMAMGGGPMKKKGMAAGGMMKKKKGYATGGMKKKKGYAMGGPMKKGYAMGGPMKKGYKKGGAVGGKRKGKVRGVRIASKGFRPAKMVKMKGS